MPPPLNHTKNGWTSCFRMVWSSEDKNGCLPVPYRVLATGCINTFSGHSLNTNRARDVAKLKADLHGMQKVFVPFRQRELAIIRV